MKEQKYNNAYEFRRKTFNCIVRKIGSVPYTQIAAILHCTTGGVHGIRYIMQRLYNKFLQEILLYSDMRVNEIASAILYENYI